MISWILLEKLPQSHRVQHPYQATREDSPKQEGNADPALKQIFFS